MKSYLLLVLCVVLCLGAAQGEWVVENAARAIDIRTHAEQVTTTLTLLNEDSSSASTFDFVIPARKVDNLALVQAFAVSGQRSKPSTTTLAVSPVAGDDGADATYRVTLNDGVEGGETTEVMVQTIFTHTLVPRPSTVKQDEPQLVQFTDSAVLYTPYVVKSQSTAVAVPDSNKVESHSKKKLGRVADNELVYGPFRSVKPFSQRTLKVHYENRSPFATFTRFIKEAEVSHWGNVAVTEWYDLKHTGAKLVGSFSRLDYSREQMFGRPDNSFRQIDASLPPSAHGVYYRDRIGNISTSNVRAERRGGGLDGKERRVLLELKPRFPLFGGWQIDFEVGYNLPASDGYLSKTDDGRFVVEVPFGSPFEYPVVDDAEVRIVLPEFASDIRWAIDGVEPSRVEAAESDQKRLTYLDTVGRPVFVLKAKNLVRKHNLAKLRVSYSVPPMVHFQEPLLLVGGVGLFFVFSIVYVRMSGGGNAGESSVSRLESAAHVLVEAARQTGSTRKTQLLRAREALAKSLKAVVNEHPRSSEAAKELGKAARMAQSSDSKGSVDEAANSIYSTLSDVVKACK